jgi:hypothetical protein
MTITPKIFFKKNVKFLFASGFFFWLVLMCLELLFPGMVIHYVNMNYWLLAVCLLAIINVVF